MTNSVKVYKVKSFAFTPFNNNIDLNYLRDNGIVVTENIEEADILISQNFKHLKKYFWRFFGKKKYVVWTLEPRFDTTFVPERIVFFGTLRCHFMNIYTKDVFTSGLTFHSHNITKNLYRLNKDYVLKKKNIVALISYFKGPNSPQLLREGKDIDLIKTRSKIAMEGRKRGVLDIFGKGWPDNISKEDSREGNWKLRKFEILNNYSFNLCFENTVAPNYITEKIWDSIENYCLPIYYGNGNDIYKIFPRDSFLDYADFVKPEQLLDYIKEMTDLEYVERLNKCIAVYNNISLKGNDFVWKQRKESLDQIICRFKNIVQK